MASRENP